MRENHPIIGAIGGGPCDQDDVTIAERYLIHPAKYHISVAVLGLKDVKNYEKTVDLLQGPIKALIATYTAAGPMPVTVKGIDDFRVGRVHVHV